MSDEPEEIRVLEMLAKSLSRLRLSDFEDDERALDAARELLTWVRKQLVNR